MLEAEAAVEAGGPCVGGAARVVVTPTVGSELAVEVADAVEVQVSAGVGNTVAAAGLEPVDVAEAARDILVEVEGEAAAALPVACALPVMVSVAVAATVMTRENAAITTGMPCIPRCSSHCTTLNTTMLLEGRPKKSAVCLYVIVVSAAVTAASVSVLNEKLVKVTLCSPHSRLCVTTLRTDEVVDRGSVMVSPGKMM